MLNTLCANGPSANQSFAEQFAALPQTTTSSCPRSFVVVVARGAQADGTAQDGRQRVVAMGDFHGDLKQAIVTMQARILRPTPLKLGAPRPVYNIAWTLTGPN